MPQYKKKEMNGFASKSLRTLEVRKGAISNEFYKQKLVQSSQSQSRFSNNQETSLGEGDKQDEEDFDSENDFEYVEDSTPGPGYYYDDKKLSSFKFGKNKNKKFTIGRNRFMINKNDINLIGPGQYNPQLSGLVGQNPHAIKCRNPPFLSSDTRFEIKKQENKMPGPGQYDINQNLEDKLIDKLKKGYRGSFGTTQKRFKGQNDINEFPGPGAYIEIIKEESEQDVKSPSAVFQSSLDRCLYGQQKDQKPPVGTYEVNFFDIQKKVNSIQEDPYIKIKVANLGFNTSQPRFKDLELKQNKKINDGENEDDDLYNDFVDYDNIRKNFKNPYKKANRFNYKINQEYPAPGNYHDPQALANNWNKRTYNINFADF
ncbi:hypothetical protein IMG5_148890 [Ichthyophthirius multifiliis]|uniref:Sperm-tail PG-rich repeat protein n=1 Tax=Ichthyophthirius multifiliis TaxID=5932 RepID=G0QYD8_ICHMU|nr:hypothetical protein IMG5_148890 [Ichthyophthirius multifiliis]EGR29763.1 hypothetical protein IMG5_148890 [Ichthyophthirius multifiliis]|eukprot:XP_004030999.1 hypothetical protein IMG5_148890 [Ichthyophthirius multifiliis]